MACHRGACDVTWFRLEDSFHQHPKVVIAGNAAVGLWVRCGTYSAQYLTDGHVPLEIAHAYGRPREIGKLLEARLWTPNGDDGFVIPDFLQFNPERAEVLRRRVAAAERQARHRARGEQGRWE